MQVSSLSLLFMVLTALMGIALPVGLLLYFRKRLGCSVVPFFFGCAAFLVFALILESIVHNIVRATPAGDTIWNNIWLYGLYGGLMAGIFEETGRFAAMKLLKKKFSGDKTALMYGVGHGSFEVLTLLTIGMAQNIVLSLMINLGMTESLLAPLDAANREAVITILQALTTTAPYMYLVSILERIIAVAIHVSLSVLVWQAATKEGKLWMYPAAIGLHALTDFAAVILNNMGIPAIVLEAILAVFAWALVCLAKTVYNKE